MTSQNNTSLNLAMKSLFCMAIFILQSCSPSFRVSEKIQQFRTDISNTPTADTTQQDHTPDVVPVLTVPPENVALSGPQTTQSSSPINTGAISPATELYQSQTGSGFNNYFIAQYLISRYGNCAECPTNMHAMSKDEIKKVLSQVHGTSIHHFREGLALRSHFPAKNSIRYVDDVAEILKLYQDSNATVIITFGMPLPTWMSGVQSSWCPMPESDSEWLILKNNMSHAIGGLFAALWTHQALNQNWMKDHLIIEPMNEFDAIQTQRGQNCSVGYGTGKRAADLTGGIRFVLKQNGVPLAVTTPSAVMGNPNYFKDFYEAGGIGQPNIHLYPPYDGNNNTSIASVDNYLDKVVSHLTQTNAVIPQQYRNRFILGEYGLAGAEGPCQASDRPGGTIAGEASRLFLNKAFGDSRIRAMTEVNMIWRGLDVAPQDFNAYFWSNPALRCEATFGVIRTDYSPKIQLVEYLRANDQIDLITDKSRLGFLHLQINQLFQSIIGRQATEIEIQGILNRRIYQDAAWAEIEMLIANLAMSDSELFNYVKYVYKTILERTDVEIVQDLGGTTYWVNQLKNGFAKEQLISSVRASTEYKIRQIYKEELRRKADSEGLLYWIKQVELGAIDLNGVRASLRDACVKHLNGECPL